MLIWFKVSVPQNKLVLEICYAAQCQEAAILYHELKFRSDGRVHVSNINTQSHKDIWGTFWRWWVHFLPWYQGRFCKCMNMSNLSIWCLLNICNLLYVNCISTRLKGKSTLSLLLKASFTHEAWLRTNGKGWKRKWLFFEEVTLLEELKCLCRQFPNAGIGQ